MTKSQNEKFNKLWETTLCWGDDSNCIGLYGEFGGNLERLATCTVDGSMEILEFDGANFDLYEVIPLNSTAKSKFKRVVSHLIDGGFETINI